MSAQLGLDRVIWLEDCSSRLEQCVRLKARKFDDRRESAADASIWGPQLSRQLISQELCKTAAHLCSGVS